MFVEIGNTPLHVCFECGVSEELILLMIRSNPTAILITNNDSRLPLHYACEYGASLELVLALFATPYLLVFRDNEGDTPLSLLWNEIREGLFEASDDIPVRVIHNLHVLKYLFTWVLFGRKSKRCMNRFDMVRAGIFLGDQCPQTLFDYLISTVDNLNSLNSFRRNILHHLCLGNRQPFFDSQRFANNVMSINKQSSWSMRINSVIKEEANLAICIDIFGRIPLHYALLSRQCHDEAEWINGIMLLLGVAPETAHCKDLSTGMLPFMLAAVNNSKSIEMTFILLRYHASSTLL